MIALAVSTSHQANLGRYQRQVRHRGRYEQLVQRLDAAEVPCLSHSQLHQASDAMLCRLSQLPVHVKLFAALEGARLLQQRLLGMEAHRSPLTWTRRDALRSQRTHGAHLRGKL